MKNKLLLTMILGSMLLGITGCRNEEIIQPDDDFERPVTTPQNDYPPDQSDPGPDYGDDGWEDGEYPEP